jgi:hypothetical protein
MKKLLMVIMVLLFTAGIAYAKDYTVTKQAGDYTVQLKMDKNPPVAGENKTEITIKDRAGADVTDATVEIEYTMPAMNYKSTAEMKDKKYTGTLNFSMSGAWGVNVKITRAGKTQSVKFNVDIS